MVTVKVEVPFPPVTVAELKPQVGDTAAAGELVTVQVRATSELNPFEGATVIVEVEVAPAEMVAGLRAVAVTANEGAAATTRLTETGCVRFPDVPVTVTAFA